MGFKEDADFARFVSMGAVGTAAVADHLRSPAGHVPIELERYAMANKVWHTKVKRLRLPDLVCVRCGLRVESRAKSKLSIVLSHSNAPDRGWDAGGMRDQDLYAFLRADLSEFPPRVSRPSFFTTGALREALDQAKLSDPKAASEGSEVTLTWPSWTPSRNGKLIGQDEEGRILCEWEDGTVYPYWQWRNWEEPRYLYHNPGGQIVANETILAGVARPPSDLNCPGETWDVIADLESPNLTDKYAAVRAAAATRAEELIPGLSRIARDENDWRLRLEAHGSLAAVNPDTWSYSITDTALDSETPAHIRIEATFILSELDTPQATEGLFSIADPSSECPNEIRAAAAWGLGQGARPSPQRLLSFLADDDLAVRLHALVAIPELPEDVTDDLRHWLAEGQSRKAASAAFLLARHRRIDSLLKAYTAGGSSTLWAIRSLGDLPEEVVRQAAGDRLTAELEQALRPHWLGHHDWVSMEGDEGVDALGVQKVRFDPHHPTLDV